MSQALADGYVLKTDQYGSNVIIPPPSCRMLAISFTEKAFSYNSNEQDVILRERVKLSL